MGSNKSYFISGAFNRLIKPIEALGWQFKPMMSHAVVLLAIFEASRM